MLWHSISCYSQQYQLLIHKNVYLFWLCSQRPLLLGVAGPASSAATPTAPAHDDYVTSDILQLKYLQEHFGHRALRKQVRQYGMEYEE